MPDTAPSRPSASEPAVLRFFHEIGTIEQLARNRFERMLPNGLSYAQFALLNHFVRGGAAQVSLADLARAFQVSRAAMTKLIRKLAAGGLVQVVANPVDSRGKLVSITEQGVAARHAAIIALAPLVGELRRAFGDEAFEAVLPFLTRVQDWLDDRS